MYGLSFVSWAPTWVRFFGLAPTQVEHINIVDMEFAEETVADETVIEEDDDLEGTSGDMATKALEQVVETVEHATKQDEGVAAEKTIVAAEQVIEATKKAIDQRPPIGIISLD